MILLKFKFKQNFKFKLLLFCFVNKVNIFFKVNLFADSKEIIIFNQSIKKNDSQNLNMKLYIKIDISETVNKLRMYN